jgi:hypothetical protein
MRLLYVRVCLSVCLSVDVHTCMYMIHTNTEEFVCYATLVCYATPCAGGQEKKMSIEKKTAERYAERKREGPRVEESRAHTCTNQPCTGGISLDVVGGVDPISSTRT